MSAPRFILTVAVAAAMPACASPPPASYVPALLVADANAHAALIKAVTEALDGRAVTLAHDALTQSSQLLLEPARPRDAEGRLLQGRETRAPESFRLVKQGEDCVLVHERTKREFVLEGAKCVAEERVD